MTDVQREEVDHILDYVRGYVYTSEQEDDVLIVGDNWVVSVDRDGNTSEANGMEWESGWSC